MAPEIVVRAAAVLFHGELILLHRRRSESVWALPGGRVQPGESAEAAVVRELSEELGVQIRVQRLIFLVENKFTHGGKRQRERGHYFLASLPDRAALLSQVGSFPGAEPHAALEFCWFNRQHLGGINLRPSFLASALAAPQLEFRHVVVAPAGTEV